MPESSENWGNHISKQSPSTPEVSGIEGLCWQKADEAN